MCNNPGQLPVPRSEASTTAFTTLEPEHATPPHIPDQTGLLKAVIQAQKNTIAAFQLDLDEARVKIKKLQDKCESAAVVAAKHADYDRLKSLCETGFEAGVDQGIKQVSSYFCNTSQHRFRRCGNGKTH